jgi:hypothetical protein
VGMIFIGGGIVGLATELHLRRECDARREAIDAPALKFGLGHAKIPSGDAK